MSSIPANIAEGCGRNSDRELARYLLIAMGSANETEYHLLLAKDLGYLPEADYGSFVMHVAEIKKMMSGLLSRLAPAATKAQSSKLEARSSELEV
jgi:four helix bundle protein